MRTDSALHLKTERGAGIESGRTPDELRERCPGIDHARPVGGQ
ncbi:hypothetical protein [Streptomyces litmocidini]|uniref:Uncharacterized protein n=1 Tax=Streptomyces litmocidini TaxID=67318 RepID=A0ABW7TYW4_9ACTN